MARLFEVYPLFKELTGAQRGAMIFDENQPCMGFPLVISGAARVLKFSANGRDLPIIERLRT